MSPLSAHSKSWSNNTRLGSLKRSPNLMCRYIRNSTKCVLYTSRQEKESLLHVAKADMKTKSDFTRERAPAFRSKLNHLTVYCLNGANAPRYRGCLPATSYGIEAIKITNP